MEEKIFKKLEQHDQRFDKIDKKLEQHDERFDNHEVRMDAMTEAILENKASVDEIQQKLDALPPREYWDKIYTMLDQNVKNEAKRDVEMTMIRHGLTRLTDKVEEHDVNIRKIKEKIGK